jgi:hypothetical protein
VNKSWCADCLREQKSRNRRPLGCAPQAPCSAVAKLPPLLRPELAGGSKYEGRRRKRHSAPDADFLAGRRSQPTGSIAARKAVASLPHSKALRAFVSERPGRGPGPLCSFGLFWVAVAKTAL